MRFTELQTLGCQSCGIGDINNQGRCIDCGEWMPGLEVTDDAVILTIDADLSAFDDHEPSRP